MICFKATTSKINDFHFTSTVALHQNILRFQITMYQTKAMQESKCFQTLDGNGLQRTIEKQVITQHVVSGINALRISV